MNGRDIHRGETLSEAYGVESKGGGGTSPSTGDFWEEETFTQAAGSKHYNELVSRPNEQSSGYDGLVERRKGNETLTPSLARRFPFSVLWAPSELPFNLPYVPSPRQIELIFGDAPPEGEDDVKLLGALGVPSTVAREAWTQGKSLRSYLSEKVGREVTVEDYARLWQIVSPKKSRDEWTSIQDAVWREYLRSQQIEIPDDWEIVPTIDRDLNVEVGYRLKNKLLCYQDTLIAPDGHPFTYECIRCLGRPTPELFSGAISRDDADYIVQRITQGGQRIEDLQKLPDQPHIRALIESSSLLTPEQIRQLYGRWYHDDLVKRGLEELRELAKKRNAFYHILTSRGENLSPYAVAQLLSDPKILDFDEPALKTLDMLTSLVDTPWRLALHGALGVLTPRQRRYTQLVGKAIKEYGPLAVFSSELYYGGTQLPESWQRSAIFQFVADFTNPIYWLDGGPAIKVRPTTVVVGKTAEKMAKAAEAALRAEMAAGKEAILSTAVHPLPSPKQIRIAEHISQLTPEWFETRIKEILQPNWVNDTLQAMKGKKPTAWAAKIAEDVIGKAHGISLEKSTLESIVAAAAVGKLEMYATIKKTARLVTEMMLLEVPDPVGFFGFKKQISDVMKARLLPEFASEAEVAGTVEHVLINPHMYDWKGMEKGRHFAELLHEVYTDFADWLVKNGVYEHDFADVWWIHRIEKSHPSKKAAASARSIGTTPSFLLPRKAPTMMDGIKWGFEYHPNPLAGLQSYIEEGGAAVAHKWAMDYAAKRMIEAGMSDKVLKVVDGAGNTVQLIPGVSAEELSKYFPHLFERRGLELTIKANISPDDINAARDILKATKKLARGQEVDVGQLEQLARSKGLKRHAEEVQRLARVQAEYRSVLENLKAVRGKQLGDIRAVNIDAMGVVFDGIRADDARTLEIALDRLAQKLEKRPASEIQLDFVRRLQEKLRSARQVPLLDETGTPVIPQPHGVLAKSGEDVVVRPAIEGIPEFSETVTRPARFDAVAALSRIWKGKLEQIGNELDRIAGARRELLEVEIEQLRQLRRQVTTYGWEEGFIMDPSLTARILDKSFVREWNKFFDRKGLPWLATVIDAQSISTGMMASLDLSWHLIQGQVPLYLGLGYLLTNPKVGAKILSGWFLGLGIGNMTWASPKFFRRWLIAHQDEIFERIRHGAPVGGIEYFQELQSRGILPKVQDALLNNIKSPYHRANMVWWAGGEITRHYMWNALAPMFKGRLHELADFIGLATGMYDGLRVMVSPTIRAIERGILFFASSYTRAGGALIGYIFRGNMTASMARRALASWLVGAITTTMSAQYVVSTLEGKGHDGALEDALGTLGLKKTLTGWHWSIGPGFMAVRIGNNYFGLGGVLYGFLKFFAGLAKAVMKVADHDYIDAKDLIATLGAPFVRWWLSRAAPLTSMTYQLARGRTYLGYPMEKPTDYIALVSKQVLPLWISESFIPLEPTAETDDATSRLITTMGELWGLRVYPQGLYDSFVASLNGRLGDYLREDDFVAYAMPDKATEADKEQLELWRQGKLKWDDLFPVQQAMVLARLKEAEDPLFEKYKRALEDSEMRSSGRIAQYFDIVNVHQEELNEKTSALVEKFRNGEITRAQFRKQLTRVIDTHYEHLDAAIRYSPDMQTVREYFERRSRDDPELYDIYALMKYRLLLNRDFETETGEVDWAAYEKAIQDYVDEFGRDTYNRVREYYRTWRQIKGEPPLVTEISRMRDYIRDRGYWKTPPEIGSIKPNDIDRYEYPDPRIKDVILGYYKLSHPADRKQYRQEYRSVFDSNPRQEMRRSDPQLDAYLFVMGYTNKLLTKEAYTKVKEICMKTGIPLASLSESLPPETLIDSYFERQQLIEKTGSALDVRVRYYDATHPALRKWLEDNEGLEPLDVKSERYWYMASKFKELDEKYEQASAAERKQMLENDPEYAFWRNETVRKLYRANVSDEIIEKYRKYLSIDCPYGFDLRQEKDIRSYAQAAAAVKTWYLARHQDLAQALDSVGVPIPEKKPISSVNKALVENYLDRLDKGLPVEHMKYK